MSGTDDRFFRSQVERIPMVSGCVLGFVRATIVCDSSTDLGHAAARYIKLMTGYWLDKQMTVAPLLSCSAFTVRCPRLTYITPRPGHVHFCGVQFDILSLRRRWHVYLLTGGLLPCESFSTRRPSLTCALLPPEHHADLRTAHYLHWPCHHPGRHWTLGSIHPSAQRDFRTPDVRRAAPRRSLSGLWHSTR